MDLRFGEQQLPSLESARAESLLPCLLLHRDAPQPRQRLAFLLWPGSTERQAQTNLRKVLHTLRRALPGADGLIEIGPRTLRWRADAPLWLDVEHFERALAEGRLEEAVETYTGELLEGRYDEWLAEERERLAGLYLEALERLARRLEGSRHWPEAVRCAERLVAQDPLHEESHRLLMQLCRASGDRARAVRAYHVCATALERELGIEPSPETRAVYESLVATAPAARARASAARAIAPSMSPFVGRAGATDPTRRPTRWPPGALWSPRRPSRLCRRNCTAGRCSASSPSTPATPGPAPAWCSQSRTSALPSITLARCPTPPSRRPSTHSRPTAAAACMPAGSTCPNSATARSMRSSPTRPIWPRAATC
jgi:DNA-binding SARP family transcriptional activator